MSNVSESFHFQVGSEYLPDPNTMQRILKGPRKHLIMTYFSLTFIS